MCTRFQLPARGDLRDAIVIREPGFAPRFEYRATISLVARFREAT
jgi:hypothetical protein